MFGWFFAWPNLCVWLSQVTDLWVVLCVVSSTATEFMLVFSSVRADDIMNGYFGRSTHVLSKLKCTPAVNSIELSKLFIASWVWYSDRAYYGLCVLIQDIGRRFPLQPQCSYQGQQGDIRQSVRGNNKLVFEADKNWLLWEEMHQLIKWIL